VSSSGTKRTLQELLEIFADGQPAGSITPKDLRDLVVTALASESKVVDSIAALRLHVGGSGQAISVAGYYEPNDGGGGVFYWDETSTDEDNGGTIIATGLNVGRWIRRYSGPVNVKWFGAYNNGENSSLTTAAINRALKATSSIYLPNGTYLLDGPIKNEQTMTLTDYFRGPRSEYGRPNGVSIIGESRRDVVLMLDSGVNTPMIILDADVKGEASLENPVAQFSNKLSHFTIEGNGTNNGLFLRGVVQGIFSELRFNNFTNAVCIVGVDPPDAGSTLNCVFRDCVFQYSKKYGVSVEGSRAGALEFDNCVFKKNTAGGMNLSVASANITNCCFAMNGAANNPVGGGIRVSTASFESVNRGVNISGCVFEANYYNSIRMENLECATINGNIFHPYHPVGAQADCVMINLQQSGTWGVRGISIQGNRIQPGSYNPLYPIIFLRAGGQVTDVTVDCLSAPIDRHTPFLFDIGPLVENFFSGSFGVDAAWKIPPGKTIPAFTGDNSGVRSSDNVLSSAIVLDYDRAGGLGSSGFIGSRFDADCSYRIPWSGVYDVTVDGCLQGLTSDHQEIRILAVVTCPGEPTRSLSLMRSRPLSASILPFHNGARAFMQKDSLVSILFQVTGSSKVVTLQSLDGILNSLNFSIKQLR